MNIFHLSTETGTNARVGLARTKTESPKIVHFTDSKEETRTERIHRGNNLGTPTSQGLIDGDPEIDMEKIGMILPPSTRAYRIPGSDDIVGDFQTFVTTFLPDGTAKEKVPFLQKKSNTNDTNPIKMGKRIPLLEALQKFAFHNHYALAHDDGIKYEFLQKIAQELHEKQELATLGAGAKGNLPLIFIDGGSPCRAFLYGETDGEKYRLLVLLTRQELKLPEKKQESQDNDPQP